MSVGLSRVVGSGAPRVDDLEKVRGSARFAADYPLPGLCHAAVLRSPHAHARILSVDTAAAERLPGVHAVVTGSDPLNMKQGLEYADQYTIARDRARYVGEPVAAVVADDAATCRKALAAIRIEYEPLEAVFDMELALDPDCPVVIHPDAANYPRKPIPMESWRARPEGRMNVWQSWEGLAGDVDDAFRDADLVVENRFSTQRASHVAMETYHADGWFDDDGVLVIRTKNKAITSSRDHIVRMFGVPADKVRILVPYIGGDFGSSGGPFPETLLALLVLRSRRPVRLAFDRDAILAYGPHKPGRVTWIRDGVMRDGTIVAREITSVFDSGAYTGTSNIIIYVSSSATAAVGLYRVPNFRYRGYGVYTNLPPGCAFRGIGGPDLTWAIEQQMDAVATATGVDPVELRRRHVLARGERNVLGQVAESIAARECLDAAAKGIAWERGARPGDDGWLRGLGIGLACQLTPTGPAANVELHVAVDGAVEVLHSATEVGQGIDTVVAQIAAETLSIPVEQVAIGERDTRTTPEGPRTSGSRSTFYIGNAVLRAAEAARAELLARAAPLLNAAPEELRLDQGRVVVDAAPERGLSLGELLATTGDAGPLVAHGAFSLKGVDLDAVTGRSEKWVAYYSYGAYAVQLAVNPATGETRVERVAAAIDMGQPINPTMCRQQIQGAIAQGIGMSLVEELLFDADGRVVNASLMNYKIPLTVDMPSGEDLFIELCPSPESSGPFGAKGLGEIALTPFYAAVGNAFFAATGTRIHDLPLAKERVYAALHPGAGDGA